MGRSSCCRLSVVPMKLSTEWESQRTFPAWFGEASRARPAPAAALGPLCVRTAPPAGAAGQPLGGAVCSAHPSAPPADPGLPTGRSRLGNVPSLLPNKVHQDAEVSLTFPAVCKLSLHTIIKWRSLFSCSRKTAQKVPGTKSQR